MRSTHTLRGKWAEFLEIKEDEVLVNLLLTLKCNFACKHCMYACHPGRDAAYMSDQDLTDIREFIEELKGIGFSEVRVNLVGGEPTLDMFEFARCYNEVRSWDVTMEMTTNGWWLRKWEDLGAFAAIVANDVADEKMTIRISNSEFHDVFRKEEKHAVHNNARVAEYMRDEVGAPSKLQCPICDKEVSAELRWEDSPACPHCKEAIDTVELDEQFDQRWAGWRAGGVNQLIEAIEDGSFFSLETHWEGDHRVSPVGRALAKGIGRQDAFCSPVSDIKFTFMPGGALHDVCCNGGRSDLGHAKDGLALLFRRHSYLTELHRIYPGQVRRLGLPRNEMGGERCANCAKCAAAWKPKHSRLFRESLKMRDRVLEEKAALAID